MILRVGLAGCGRWGQRLLRVLRAHPLVRVGWVVDASERARAVAASLAPEARVVPSLADAVQGGADAWVVATPSHLHAAHGLEVLRAGADVLIEKPLALCTHEAFALLACAQERQSIGMVGHVLRYHRGHADLIAAVHAGVVGPLRQVRAVRLTSSGSPDPLWTLAPHDLATLHALDESPVTGARVDRRGGRHRLLLSLASGLEAELEVATDAAAGERHITVHGRLGTVRVDELAGGQLVTLTQGVRRAEPPAPDASLVDWSLPDPLSREIDHFVRCVITRQTPLTSFAHALPIVEALELAEQADTVVDSVAQAAR